MSLGKSPQAHSEGTAANRIPESTGFRSKIQAAAISMGVEALISEAASQLFVSHFERTLTIADEASARRAGRDHPPHMLPSECMPNKLRERGRPQVRFEKGAI
jgi:hypothetical protein